MTKPLYRLLVVTTLLLSCSFARAASISARTSGNWNATTTWLGGALPTASDDVTIPASFTVTVNTTTAVVHNLTINSNGTLKIGAGDNISVAGNLSNAGTVTMSGTNSVLTFNGSSNSTISYSGGVYSLAGNIVLNMGSSTTALDVQDQDFILGINSGGKYYFTFTRGIFRMDNTASLTNAYNYNTNNALTIPYGVTIESDKGTMNLATKGTSDNVILSGKLFMNGGTVNVQTGQGTNSGQDFEYNVNGGTPQLYISGGSLTIGAGFNAKKTTDYIDFNMTAGTMLIAANGYSNQATFQLQNVTGGQTSMSGGTIIEQQPGSGSYPDLDMGGPNVASTLYSVTGGTVQLGNAATTNSTTFYAIQPYSTTNYPNIDNEPGTTKTTGSLSTGNLNMLSLKYNSNTTFDATDFTTLTITNSNTSYAWDGEGSFTPSTNKVVFAGGEEQIILSSALSNITFYNLQIANTSGNVVLKVPVKVNNLLSFTSGMLDASADYVYINNGSRAITGTGNTSYIITGDGVTKTGYLAINAMPNNTAVLFPIGNATYYLPATVNPGNNPNTAYEAYVYRGVTTNAQSSGTSVSAAILGIMADATWNITKTAGAAGATLGLNWAPSGTTLEGWFFQRFGTMIGITQFTGGTWQPAAGSGSEPAHTATATFSSFTQFSVTGTPIALPVVLADFEAVPKGRTSALSWDAYPDGQPASFTIQRSLDGTSWGNIGLVQADVTATTETAYSYTDAAPAAGENYYRLFIQNEDGSTSYSPVRPVAFTSTAQISVYPNPANTALTVNVGNSNKALAIRLVNTAGQVLQSRVVEAGVASSLAMNTGVYPAGVYYVEIFEDGQLLQTTTVLVAH